jgi:hypothetical protein
MPDLVTILVLCGAAACIVFFGGRIAHTTRLLADRRRVPIAQATGGKPAKLTLQLETTTPF